MAGWVLDESVLAAQGGVESAHSENEVNEYRKSDTIMAELAKSEFKKTF